MKYIKCVNIRKKYKNNIVLNNFNFTFSSNNINFIQGANGTGKTTLILCILGFLKYNGIIKCNFENFIFQPEKVILPDYLSVEKYFNLLLEYHKQNNNYQQKLIKIFDMEDNLKKDIINLSKGMRQKVLIIQTLMIDCDCYIFDEPLSGLDPESQVVFTKEINNLFMQDKLIIIITHFPELYNFNDKVVIDFNKKDEHVFSTS